MKRLVTIMLLAIIQVVVFAQRGKVRPEWDIDGRGSHHSIDDDFYSFLIIIGLLVLFVIYMFIRGLLTGSNDKNNDNSTIDEDDENENYSKKHTKKGCSEMYTEDSILEEDDGLHNEEQVKEGKEEKTYIDDYGIEYNSDKSQLIRVANGKKVIATSSSTSSIRFISKQDLIDGLESYVVINGTHIICDGAFRDCYCLESITIPNSVVTIGKDIFEGCSSLSKIRVPIGTKPRFEKLLAEYKDKLVESEETNYLSTGVTKLDILSAWSDDYDVKYSKDRKRLIKSPDFKKTYSATDQWLSSMYEAEEDLIHGDFLKKLHLDSFQTSYFLQDHYKKAEYKIPPSIKEYYINDGTEVICDYAFMGCDGLESIHIPEGVKAIGSYSFSGCKSLSHITIPSSVRNIDYMAFSGCVGLSSIVFNGSDIGFGKEVFSDCINIESIVIPIRTMKEYGDMLPEYKDKLVERKP